ncbi:hypothetical protein E1295_21215 [Nonomuraea mesophila]|uniref:Uncharacterized protein n=1 Tax=Nonomuraea mesophila TaxID=2530382 RepID=A0A4R5FED2_9ACTN|nr:hypothetical protein E1295_21215 [Nonomuraea mesophila]
MTAVPLWPSRRAGLSGGKGVSETVSAHPRAFVTLTAPSFDPSTRTATATATRCVDGVRGGRQGTDRTATWSPWREKRHGRRHAFLCSRFDQADAGWAGPRGSGQERQAPPQRRQRAHRLPAQAYLVLGLHRMLYNCFLLTGQAEAVALRSCDGSYLVIVDQQVIPVDWPALHPSGHLVRISVQREQGQSAVTQHRFHGSVASEEDGSPRSC